MMMNEQQYFHWDLLRQPIQAPTFGMGAPFFDVNSILELRKEKSRDAARSRRGKENYEFYELAKLLPLPAAITSQLDKASIIRLSISYLKLRDFSGHGDPPWNRDPGHHVKTVKAGPPRRRGNSSVALDLFESHHGTHILQSLDGFAFILGNDGRFLYISETVSIYLGLSQVEMAGSSIFDYVHQQDHPELAEHLGLCLPQGSSSGLSSPGSSDEGSPSSGGTTRCMTPPGHDLRGYVMNPNPKKGCDRSFCLRMKSTLTKRGVHVKSSGYRVVHVLGQLRPQMTMGLGRKCGAPVLGLVGVAIALPPPTVTELRLEHDTFITRMAPDFTVTFCESLVSDFMDLSAEDMTNRSLYDMCHAGDIANLRQAHVNVLTKGQAMTDYYRLLNRQGGYVWIQTCATTLLNGKNADDQNILSINYVLSGVEKGNSVMNMWQMCGEVSPAQPRASSPATASLNQGQSSGKDRGSLTDKDEKTKGSNLQNKDSNKGPQSNQKMFSTRSPSHVGLGSVGGGDSGDGDTDGLSDSDVVEMGGDSGGQYAEKNGAIQDAKNSRRKMERPRKRKREELDGGSGKGSGRGVPGSLPPDSRLSSPNGKDVGRSPPSRTGVGSAPQDLSLKPSSSPSPAAAVGSGSLPSPIVQSPTTDSARPANNTITTNNNNNNNVWPRGAGGNSDSVSEASSLGSSSVGCLPPPVTSNTVKELEAVMNRHLPFLDNEPMTSHPDASRLGHARTGSSVSSCNTTSSSSYHAQAAKKSTIQWVGSHASTADVDAMTASKFLRSLYESRESVIRSSGSCHAAVNGSSNSTAVSNGNNNNNLCSSINSNNNNSHGLGPRVNHVYPDVTGSLLTPPAGGEYRDQPPPFSIPSIVISSPSSHASSAMALSSSCSSPISSSSSSASSLKGGSGYRYPTALSLSLPCAGLAEAYGMTPPASVSPHDKHASPFAAAALAYNESPHPGPCGLRSHHTLSPASSPATHGVSKDPGVVGSCGSMSGVHAQDYGTAKAAYYAMSALGSGHGGYADVNHNTAAAYDQCSRSVIPWY